MTSLEPTVALVFSPETWVEELHRHLSHHGGARVRQVVVEPAVALDEQYDVLVVSDRWPALTHGFVVAVHGRGRAILGVFDPDEPAGKDHLVELGVDATIAADAVAAEFVVALGELGPDADFDSTPHVRSTASAIPTVDDAEPIGKVIAVCGPRGSGVTEVALGVATSLGGRRRTAVLLDAHETAPALAGRLGLGLEPNLRTAIDACAHGLGVIDDCVAPVTRAGRGGLGAIPGHPSAMAASQVTTQDLLDVVTAARIRYEFVAVDLEERTATARALLAVADTVVLVMSASPVGVVRALEWAIDELGRTPGAALHVMVNRAPRSRFRQEEIRSEIERTIRPSSIGWCPQDRCVEHAAWDGHPVRRGPFSATCARLGQALDPAAVQRRKAWSR